MHEIVDKNDPKICPHRRYHGRQALYAPRGRSNKSYAHTLSTQISFDDSNCKTKTPYSWCATYGNFDIKLRVLIFRTFDLPRSVTLCALIFAFIFATTRIFAAIMLKRAVTVAPRAIFIFWFALIPRRSWIVFRSRWIITHDAQP